MALTDKERLTITNLLEQISLAEKAAQVLRYSYHHRPDISPSVDFSDADWEYWDALAARFARLADILTQRVFRAIDMVEFLPVGSTYLDRIHRAEKRGHIQSAFAWKEIREIRNQIVHEYASEHLVPMLQDIINHISELLQCVVRLQVSTNELKLRLLGEG